jgi:hypothetical protein
VLPDARPSRLYVDQAAAEWIVATSLAVKWVDLLTDRYFREAPKPLPAYRPDFTPIPSLRLGTAGGAAFLSDGEMT